MVKSIFNRKKTFFTMKLNLRKKLAMCYIWGIAFCSNQ